MPKASEIAISDQLPTVTRDPGAASWIAAAWGGTGLGQMGRTAWDGTESDGFEWGGMGRDGV